MYFCHFQYHLFLLYFIYTLKSIDYFLFYHHKIFGSILKCLANVQVNISSSPIPFWNLYFRINMFLVSTILQALHQEIMNLTLYIFCHTYTGQMFAFPRLVNNMIVVLISSIKMKVIDLIVFGLKSPRRMIILYPYITFTGKCFKYQRKWYHFNKTFII